MFSNSFKNASRGNALQQYVQRYRVMISDRNADIAANRAVRLRRSDAVMSGIFATTFDCILIIDSERRIAAANQSAAKLFEMGERAPEDIPLAEILPAVAVRLAAQAEGAADDSSYHETDARSLGGRAFPVEYAINRTDAGGERSTVVVLRDISERRAQQRRLEFQANHDALTKLPNRPSLGAHLNRLIAEVDAGTGPTGFSLLLIDLDRFKDINDTLGHDVGDELLCQVARRLTNLAKPNQIVARLGGDEFAIILPDCPDADSASAMAERFGAEIARPFTLRDLSISIGSSIGVALHPENATNDSGLMKCADVAMYLAKDNGHTVSVYDASADHNSIRHLTLTGELKRAIENADIYFNYQPKLCLASGRVQRAEALARWHHEKLGHISPDEFIIQAERTGLINDLTRLTLETACAQMADWRRRNIDMGVAINLSARMMYDVALAEDVAEHLSALNIPPEKLTIEVTESAVMHDADTALAVAHALAETGIRLSIDDFGTGYSSLAYLTRLPVHELKIDKAFVGPMIERTHDAAIVRSTMELAHSLGLAVVAEGVETVEIARELRRLGCEYAQGYLVSKPIDAETFEREVYGPWSGWPEVLAGIPDDDADDGADARAEAGADAKLAS